MSTPERGSEPGFVTASVPDLGRELPSAPRQWSEASEAAAVEVDPPGISARDVGRTMREAASHFPPPDSPPPISSLSVARTVPAGSNGASLGIEYLLACLAGALAIAAFIAGRIAVRQRPSERVPSGLLPACVVMAPPLAEDDAPPPWRRLPAVADEELSFAPAHARHAPPAAADVAATHAMTAATIPAKARAQPPTKAPVRVKGGDEDIEKKLQRLLRDWSRAAA